MDSIKDHKEVLSDPNKHLSAAEIRLGRGLEVKTLSKLENKHEKILLGDLYTDKEFLRYFSQRIFQTSTLHLDAEKSLNLHFGLLR